MAQNPVPLTAEYNAMMNAIYANIEKFDTEKDLNEFNQIIRENKYYKLNILDLIEKMQHFHRFTPESLDYMIKVINKNPNTFLGYGPYVKVDGYWKTINIPADKETLIFQKKIIHYAQQIEEQKQYIILLETKIKSLERNSK